MIFEISGYVKSIKKENLKSNDIVLEEILINYSGNLIKKGLYNEMVNDKISDSHLIYYERAYLIYDYLYTLKLNDSLKNYITNCKNYLKDKIFNKN